MSMEIMIQIISLILPVGIFYGATQQRIKQIEKHINDQKPLIERLASVEAKLDFLINKK
jgi:uncharacterized protein YneF (UPF0154 family)